MTIIGITITITITIPMIGIYVHAEAMLRIIFQLSCAGGGGA
jgi:hypothetical protein